MPIVCSVCSKDLNEGPIAAICIPCASKRVELSTTAPNTGILQLLQEAHDLLSMPCTTVDRVVARQKIALYLQQQQAGA